MLISPSDEVLYHANLHPEQYSDTFSSEQVKQLHASIMHICQTAVDVLGDSSKFPDEWLFNHRWGKGKKDASTTLPNGARITFITVGGRTSCVVPSVQKKTGAVAGDVKMEEANNSKAKMTKKRKAADENESRNVKVEPAASKKAKGRARGKESEIADAVNTYGKSTAGRRRSGRISQK
jgi:formamidopyrimidine-DNA glycosylase